MYRFNSFTQKANEVLNLAIKAAENYGHNYVGSEHILVGLLKEGTGLGAATLNENGITLDDVDRLIKEEIGVGNPTRLSPDDFTPRSKRIIELSFQIARGMMHSFVGTEHLLISLVKESDSYAVRFINELGVDVNQLLENLIESLNSGESDAKQGTKGARKGKTKTPTLDEFGKDLTELAKQGKIDPVIGRDEEIKRVIQILSRRSKNNPCLIGEPGVGADTRLTDKARVVFAPTRKDLDNSFDFFVPADNRVDFALLCKLGQIFAEFVKGRGLCFAFSCALCALLCVAFAAVERFNQIFEKLVDINAKLVNESYCIRVAFLNKRY